METNKKISEMTEEEMISLPDDVVVSKLFEETVDDINIDTKYMNISVKNAIGSMVVSLCLIPFGGYFLLSFLIPIYFIFCFHQFNKLRKNHIKLFNYDYSIYSDGKFLPKEKIDEYKNKIDLEVKLF